LLERNRQAIVKVIVRGTTPTDSEETREGSGFFIYSGNGTSYLVTAAHVIGSNSTEQNNNSDWKVELGSIKRTIEVLSLDEHGSLMQRSNDAQWVPAPLALGVDLALLMIYQDNFRTLPLATTLSDRLNDFHDVMLIGFPSGSTNISRPTPIGIGQLKSPSTFSIVNGVGSQPGESGAPWIDLHSGRVFGVATAARVQANRVSSEATPITLIMPALQGPLPAGYVRVRQEEEIFREARGDILRLKEYLAACVACEFKDAVQSELSSLQERQRRRERAREEEEAYRVTRGDLTKLKIYVATCTVCEFKIAAQSEINSIEEQERRAERALQEERTYAEARGDLERLRAYISGCSICEFKVAAQSEAGSLEEQQRRAERVRHEEVDYRDARGSLEKLRIYVTTCTICQFKDAAQSEITSLDEQQRQAERSRQEEQDYRDARGDLDKLRTYLTTCSICQFKQAAQSEIRSVEEQQRRVERAREEAMTYRAARGNIEKLRSYVTGCMICEYKSAAQSEITSMEEQQGRAARVRQEAATYVSALGDIEKLKSYLATCAVCEFRDAAQSEVISIGRQNCDRFMATQFDPDLSASIPFVADTAVLSESDVEQAVVACVTARESTGSRRYAAQAGRAYAARASRRSRSGNESGARSDMDEAVAHWKASGAEGSGAAMNFLGAYFKGTFNSSTLSFVSPDFAKALEYWQKGADAENAKAMRNAGGMLLVGSPDFAPVQRDVPRARRLLEKAIQRGEMTAASELGKAFFYGWSPELGKDVPRGLDLLTKACAAKDPGAREFFDLEMSRDRFRSFMPAVRPVGCEGSDPRGQGATSATPTYWDYNESVYYLLAKGTGRKFYFYSPREGLVAVGVKRDTLFFEGTREGNQYKGYAYVFSKSCAPAAYEVAGSLSSNQNEIKLVGKAPRRNASCQIVSYADDPITLTLRTVPP
jgi:hypothetical protein